MSETFEKFHWQLYKSFLRCSIKFLHMRSASSMSYVQADGNFYTIPRNGFLNR